MDIPQGKNNVIILKSLTIADDYCTVIDKMYLYKEDVKSSDKFPEAAVTI